MQQFDLGLTPRIDHISLEGSLKGGRDRASVCFRPNFINNIQASDLFNKLRSDVAWQEESLWIAGKERQVPRRVAWYGDRNAQYRYSGKLHQPLPWIEPLEQLRTALQLELKVSFNSVLCNLYRNGQDSMGWHADNEKELGDEPVIASISLGQARAFHLKHKTNPKLRHKMTLTSGSLLVMQGTTQQYWLHQVPKEPNITEPRINLTFRMIKS